MEIDKNLITFGKYNSKSIDDVLKDRSYCKWLLQQEFFKNNYEYLYNRVKEFDPKIFFFSPIELEGSFIDTYKYFNLTPIDKLQISLTENELICYKYYLNMIYNFKQKIKDNIEKAKPNPYDIKAPVNWLNNFEKETKLSRDEFKKFINCYELNNLPYIIKDIKEQAGISYHGADIYNIVKERSLKQEAFWEKILKEKYGEDIGSQYKYDNSVFDFINISKKILYECKLNLQSFNIKQYDKYVKATKGTYEMIYLISDDCILNITKQVIYTKNVEKYKTEIVKLCTSNITNSFLNTLLECMFIETESIVEIFNEK